MTGTTDRTPLVWMGIGAAVAALLFSFWLVGAASSAIFGSGWTTVALAKMIVVPFGLGGHLGDPRQAWPPPMRRAMPGAVGVYATAGLVLAGFVATGFVAVRAVGGGRLELGTLFGGRRRASVARWARRGDLRKLFVSGPVAGRVVLGHAFGQLIAAESRQSVIVLGPTGSYKTAGLAIPVLREWAGPVVATSVKSDLVLNALAARQKRGKVWIFDPARVTSQARSKGTPLLGCETWRGSLKVAHWLTRATQTGSDGIDNADFWYRTAERLIAPLLLAAATTERPISDVLRWVEEGTGAVDEVDEALGTAGEGAAKRAWAASWDREERARSSVRTTAETILAAYADPFVAKETRRADFGPGDLLGGDSNTLFLCAPETEQERLRPLFSTLIQQVVDAAYTAASRRGSLDPALLLLLDEAANIAPIPALAGLAATGGGQGIQLVTVFQDLAQIRKQYGDAASTIVNNHGARILTSGTGDGETLRWVMDVTGMGEFGQRSTTAGEEGRRMVTEATTHQPIAPPSEVREMEPGSALMVYRGLPLTRVSLRDYRKLGKIQGTGRMRQFFDRGRERSAP
jgi:type IV secretion system protein VirD4